MLLIPVGCSSLLVVLADPPVRCPLCPASVSVSVPVCVYVCVYISLYVSLYVCVSVSVCVDRGSVW